MEQRDYITRFEAAEILDVHVRTIDRCIINGTLTKYQLRWRVYLDREEVVKLVEIQPVEAMKNVS